MRKKKFGEVTRNWKIRTKWSQEVFFFLTERFRNKCDSLFVSIVSTNILCDLNLSLLD